MFIDLCETLRIMKVINLGERNTMLNNYVAQLRDRTVQKDRMRFRTNLERIGYIFGYEISQTLDYEAKDVETPLGIARMNVCSSSLVIATILRAGLPLHKGLMDCFDEAGAAFIAAHRKYDRGESFHISIEACTSPDLDGKVLVMADTMLATGASIEVALDRLYAFGKPRYTHLVCPIASAYAVEYLQKRLDGDITLWAAAVDEELTSHSYIVPGLGDAGDLAFGEKR